MARAGHQLVARERRAVQEEHQGDAQVGDHAQVQRAVAGANLRGQQRDADGGEHDQYEPVDQVVDFLEG